LIRLATRLQYVLLHVYDTYKNSLFQFQATIISVISQNFKL